MFEKEIQFITDFNLNKIKTLGPSFTINKLFEVNLHPALIKYISGRLEYLIYKDRMILLENSSYDYSGGKISDYFSLIADEMKKTKKLTYSEVKAYIENGIVFNANFCVQPKSTLVNLIYKNSESKVVGEIKVYLNYIYYYGYLRDILNSFFTKKKIVNLSRTEFSSILEKIDGELLAARKEEIISDALNSIADFYNDGGVNKSSIHSSLAEAFMKDKNLSEEVVRIQKYTNEGKRKTEIDELKVILSKSEVLPYITEQKAEETEIEIESETPQIKSELKPVVLSDFEFEEEIRKVKEDKIENVIKETIDEEIEHVNVKNEKIENSNNSERILNIDEDEDSVTNETIFEEEIIDNEIEEKGNEIEEIIEKEIPPVKGNKVEKDLLSFLSKKEIEKIVSIIFNEDGDDFANTMEKISECSNYEQASEILKSVFFTYRINPYTREAVALTNAVSNYFHQEN